MATRRAPGMDHDLYDYSAIPDRPALEWPNKANLAFWTLLHLEYWELIPPEGSYRDPRFKGEFGNYFPDFRTWSTREYGNRVGIFRVLEVLDKAGLVSTVAINAMACQRYPDLIKELDARGCDFVCHGIAATRMITNRMSESEERASIEKSLDAVTRCIGRRPSGWLSQDFGLSTRTFELLTKVGMKYVLDLANDEQPFLMKAGKPPLVAIPNPVEWDDQQLFLFRKVPPQRYPDLVSEAAVRMGSDGGRALGLSLHPWVIGMPQRIRYLREAMEKVLAQRSVWKASADDIANHFMSYVRT